MKTILSMFCIILLSNSFFAQSENQFLGEWQNISPRGSGCGGGCPTALKIYKDGNLFIIDESRWSSGGRYYGIVTLPKAYKAKFKDGSLEISNGFGMTIDYGTSSGHIFFKDQEFSKSNSELINNEKEVPNNTKIIFNTFKDKHDGIIYKTVKIGTQTWMAENLNVSYFRNGDTIPEAKTIKEWTESGDKGKPVWCYYDNKPDNGKKFGKLYNWYAVNDKRGLAPNEWHIPAKTEFEILSTTVYNISNSLKALDQGIGSAVGTNTSGFSALLAGFRFFNGNFVGLRGFTNFWSSTDGISNGAYVMGLSGDNSDGSDVKIYNSGKDNGFSVRCIKN